MHEATGETRVYTCGYLISCTGYYNYDSGYLPSFPGADRFAGRAVHPQHWPEDLDYTGKKVVVIGSGATAVTLVPAMAGDAAHVTMLQRSPSYVFSLPAFDKISEFLGRFLSEETGLRDGPQAQHRDPAWVVQGVPALSAVDAPIPVVAGATPRRSRRFDMSHFTPKYMPWDERLCAVPDGDLFDVLASGEASVVTDEIETFTETGILLKSGRHLEADIIVTATGLNLQMLGGMQLSVDGEARALHDQMTYKGILVEDIPNLAWMFGYTNAPWTLKSDIAGEYLVRLFRHMDDNGLAVATPRDVEGCALDDGMLDQLQSGYVQRAKDVMPRQGSKLPWKVLMHFEKDSKMLLDEPVEDGVLSFDATRVGGIRMSIRPGAVRVALRGCRPLLASHRVTVGGKRRMYDLFTRVARVPRGTGYDGVTIAGVPVEGVRPPGVDSGRDADVPARRRVCAG